MNLLTVAQCQKLLLQSNMQINNLVVNRNTKLPHFGGGISVTYNSHVPIGKVVPRTDDSPKVFLGGTCNESTWRDELIPMLEMDYFNPVVSDWNLDAQEIEEVAKELCEYKLFTITKEIRGVYSIAEMVEEGIKNGSKTIVCILLEGFDKARGRSLVAVARLLRKYDVKIFHELKLVADYLNFRRKQWVI